jgi:alpha-ketoglutarate-dependent taurine dioxygenase
LKTGGSTSLARDTDRSPNDLEPPKAAALYAVKLPATGGDTRFVNIYQHTMGFPKRKRIDGLKARQIYAKQIQRAKAPEPYARA